MKIALWLVRMELFFPPFILILWGREIQGVGLSQYSKLLKGTVVPPSFYSTLKKNPNKFRNIPQRHVTEIHPARGSSD